MAIGKEVEFVLKKDKGLVKYYYILKLSVTVVSITTIVYTLFFLNNFLLPFPTIL